MTEGRENRPLSEGAKSCLRAATPFLEAAENALRAGKPDVALGLALAAQPYVYLAGQFERMADALMPSRNAAGSV